MKKIFSFVLAAFLFPFFIFAGIIGGEPAKSWIEGSHDYVMMFNTLLKDTEKIEGYNEDKNPQGDRCIDSSSFDLTNKHIPIDAEVENAYLVWTGTVEPSKLTQPTDNTAVFSFVSGDGKVKIENREVAASKAYLLSDENQGFEFEGFAFKDDNNVYTDGYFTYRVDITDIFSEIQKKGREAGIQNDGEIFMGKYTVGGIDCSEADVYRKHTGMFSAWAIVLVYRSESIAPKKIYFYNGMEIYQRTSSVLSNQIIQVKGFSFPVDAVVRVSLMTAEGDPDMVIPFDDNFKQMPPEGLRMRGDSDIDWLQLSNSCNPQKTLGNFSYTEMYNSISSFYGWDDEKETCIGSQNAPIYGVDVDTFVMNATDPLFAEHLFFTNNMLEFDISANEDIVFSNFLIVSVDTKAPSFDIPGRREKDYCSCSTMEDKICPGQNFYYVVRIENWGEDVAKNVMFRDPLPETVKYVPGTAQIAKTFKEDGTPVWESVPDGSGGKFPFAESYKIADSLTACKSNCKEKAMVRFKVSVPLNIPKNELILNTATIASASGEYKSNLGVPLRLRVDSSCPAECEPDPNSAECGGGVGAEVPDNKPDNDEINPDESLTDSDSVISLDKDSSSENDTSSLSDEDSEEIGEDSSACGCTLI